MPRVAVALSGGRDSAALLVATARVAPPLGVDVVALHVHHGLSDQADAWLGHCERLCARLGVPMAHRRLDGRPGRGASVEAWAREQRYRALHEMAVEHGASLVLLAHHRRDQAETVLLQALRGAGPAGWAAMPRTAQRHGITWARPWLEQPREQLEAYVAQHRIATVEDDTNAQTRYARNRLRSALWPALKAAFPDAEVTLALAARQAQAARLCLDEVAAEDLATCSDGSGLRVADWRRLAPGRRDNALRAWVGLASGRPPSRQLLDRVAAELEERRVQRWPVEGGGELRHYRGRLGYREPDAAAVPAGPPEPALSIRRAGRYRLPGWGGVLVARRVAAGGVALPRLGSLELRRRSGGERFQLAPGAPARSLKKQFQTLAVAPWQRGGPLVYDAAGRLLYVPGLGIDARACGEAGEAQLSLQWEPLPPPA